MKYLLIISLFMVGCQNKEYWDNAKASNGKEACFANGGTEYQFHQHTLSGTCVYHKGDR